MNLMFRFVYHVFISRFLKPIGLNDTEIVKMRVWPNDIDVNIHLNNGRYLSIMDLGRTRMSIRSGLYHKALKNGWGFGVVGGVNITYLKSLGLFQSYYLTSKIAGHHDGWIFIEQRFESRGKLVAAALVKVVFLKDKKRLPIEEMITQLGVDHFGENKAYLAHLFDSEKEFLKYIKADYPQ